MEAVERSTTGRTEATTMEVGKTTNSQAMESINEPMKGNMAK